MAIASKSKQQAGSRSSKKDDDDNDRNNNDMCVSCALVVCDSRVECLDLTRFGVKELSLSRSPDLP